METIIRYTTAHIDYDYNYTTHLGIVARDKNGKAVRKVRIEADRADYQCGRYGSGMCNAIGEDDYQEQVGYGWMIPVTTATIAVDDLVRMRETLADVLDGMATERIASERDAREETDRYDRGYSQGRAQTLQDATGPIEVLQALLRDAETKAAS
jgi:hypothetical protein